MLIALAGILILGIVLVDIFLTVLDANGLSLISSRLYRAFWWTWRTFARILPPIVRHQVLALGAPMMIPAMIAVWLCGIVLAFTLIFYGGLEPREFFAGGGSQPSLASALRLSVVTLSTIGFVEISPSNMPYALTVAAEAILGNLILTIVITYFLSVHAAVLAYNRFATQLRARMPDEADAGPAIALHVARGDPAGLDQWLTTLTEGVVNLHESLRRYPILYYFRALDLGRGYPSTITSLAGLVTGLNHGLPRDHPLRMAPGLSALSATLDSMVEDLGRRYVPRHRWTVARPLSRAAFEAAARGQPTMRDPWVDRFLAEAGAIARVAGGETRRDPAELHAAYREWLPTAVRLSDFATTLRDDLGYAARLRPGRSSTWAMLSSGPRERPQALRRMPESAS